MNEKQTIIKMYMEGKSKRSIAKTTKKSRNTVVKYIREFEKSKQEDVRDLPLPENILKPPTYKKRVGRVKVLTEQIKNRLRQFIKENEWKRNHYMRKQQMKIIDMHEKLLDDGFSISYTTVRNFVNQETAKAKEVYIRRHCKSSYEVEFDWGEVKLVIDGKLRVYSLAVFTLPYSNYRFARIYKSESQVCVLDVHTKFIEHVEFIPTVFTYDNMRTVVKSFVGTEKTITDSMKNLANYYQFKIRLCQARKGNEKGHVERSVEYIRRKVFSGQYSFSSLDEAQVHLLSSLKMLNERHHHEHKQKHVELMKEEKIKGTPLTMTPFDTADLVECRVDKYSTIVINQNHYSVPEGYVGTYIKAKLGAETIKVFIEGKLVAVHKRNWGLHQWIMDIYHYLATFQKKKGAIAQSECLKQAPTKIKNLYNDYYIGKEREFIELLSYMKEHNNIEHVMDAVNQLMNIRSDYVSTERILFICEQSSPVNGDIVYEDDTKQQSESNMKAYAQIFDQKEEEVDIYGA
ncbi:IS21 family transposase [Anaerobacillus isosaccharinicus]|uniref:IS21 family transposase n=1 Tax=Anaerobacillus isosaccharinicus TaxID=1532552 RepID=A0A7S7RAN5_9BACI|nr:IS21 family transposase [Anaerobacillus isosaccharinicus]MBA5586715.1 IS21 family transposase [Anaerobacillus isosaccharinicus]QOY35061.1 IS21 family transposase [Anaerobacillus isosaccharinicus]